MLIMLVITRKPKERIVIAGNIIVEVVKIEKGRVRLGITAPCSVSVDREEVADCKNNIVPELQKI
jgi:carbon storage regulator